MKSKFITLTISKSGEVRNFNVNYIISYFPNYEGFSRSSVFQSNVEVFEGGQVPTCYSVLESVEEIECKLK